MHTFVDTHSRYALMTLMLASLALAGCEPEQKTRYRRRSQASDRPTQQHLLKGIDYLNRLDEFEHNVALGHAKYQFDRWLGEHEPNPAWRADPMAERGSRDVRESGILKGLADWAFTFGDVQAIQEAAWMRDITRWVGQKPPNAKLQQWLSERSGLLSEVEVEELLIAERLFDWTIRNIQLDETLDYPEQVVTPGTGGLRRVERSHPCSERPGIRRGSIFENAARL